MGQLHDGFRGDFHFGGLRIEGRIEFHAVCIDDWNEDECDA